MRANLDDALAADSSPSKSARAHIDFEATELPPDNDDSIADSLGADPGMLPVVQHRAALMSLVRNHQAVIIAGETGSGKTTQLPQFLAEERLVSSSRRLAVTQPRRLAAVAVAERVASEMHCKLGSRVGYSVRFDDRTSPETQIRFVTDGILLRELIADPSLGEYDAVMIDEAHERTLQTDIVLALARNVMRQRPEFKVLISSATLNSAKFASFFDDAPVFNVPGRRFPVQMLYTRHAEPDYIQAAVSSVLQIHMSQPLEGDILVFLPGQEDIESAEERLLNLSLELGSTAPELIVMPVYATMQPEQQAKIFFPTPLNCRKVVLATNIAETSLTIPGITYVVDTGLVKMQDYDGRSGMDSLTLRKCSQASASQRAGRAGRVGPGKCFRLYTRSTFEHEMPAETPPEVLRTNISSVCVLLLTLGVSNIGNFGFLDRPSSQAIAAALTELYALGAVNQSCELTKRGRLLAEFPTNPQMARALLSSIEYGCVREVSTVVAMLSELGGLFLRPKHHKAEADAAHLQLRVKSGDQFTLLQIYGAWEAARYSPQWCRNQYIQQKSLRRARDIKNQLEQLCARVAKRAKLAETHDVNEGLAKALISGFFMRSAWYSKIRQHYIVVGQVEPVFIHPGSVLRDATLPPELIMYHELVLTTREYMRGCMEVDPEMVRVVVPHYYYYGLEKRESARQGLRSTDRSALRSTSELRKI